MSRIGRTLATVVVVALSSWSCGSTAPDATPQVPTIVVSPSTSTLALNAQLPLQAQVQDGSGAVVPGAVRHLDGAGSEDRQRLRRGRRHRAGARLVAGGGERARQVGHRDDHRDARRRSRTSCSSRTRSTRRSAARRSSRRSAFDGSGNALTDRAIIWSSSNQAVATVSTTGLVTAVAPGTSTITAASEGKTSTVDHHGRAGCGGERRRVAEPRHDGGRTVGAARALGRATPADNVLTGKSAIWASSNTAVATVASDGTVKAITAGSIDDNGDGGRSERHERSHRLQHSASGVFRCRPRRQPSPPDPARPDGDREGCEWRGRDRSRRDLELQQSADRDRQSVGGRDGRRCRARRRSRRRVRRRVRTPPSRSRSCRSAACRSPRRQSRSLRVRGHAHCNGHRCQRRRGDEPSGNLEHERLARRDRLADRGRHGRRGGHRDHLCRRAVGRPERQPSL